MVKCGVLLEGRTEFLNITLTRCGFEGYLKGELRLYQEIDVQQSSGVQYKIQIEIF